MTRRMRALRLLLALAVLAAGCGAGGQAAPKKKSAPRPPAGSMEIKVLRGARAGYMGAVGALDRFLGAWLMGDVAQAKTFLTPEERSVLDGSGAKNAFLGKNGGQPAGFEVIGARQVSPSEYEFKVWIYRFVPGAYGPGYVIPRAGPDLVIVRRTKDSWLIATIPKEILR